MTEPGLLRSSLLHAGRVLRGARRTPLLVVQSLMFPAVLLVMFELVLSRSLMAFAPGRDAGELVALIVIIATVFGALVSGSGLFDEREAGLLARFTTVGSHAGSMLLGRVMAEVARVVCASVVLLLIGWAFGMSVHTGSLGVLAFFGVLAVIAATVGMAISTLAVTGATRSGLNLLAPVFLVLMFFNSGFAPIESFPSVVAPVVRFLPFTVGVDTLLWCLRGGPVPIWTPLLLAGWCVLVVALSGWLWATRAQARISGERTG
ncbi:ABC transporter permease [Pseudonocardia spinosispora]|uniref:ABC transporter permease n=1 Tax=Pseudonocardia spinosispora TaxID=103441 RepID=UPI000490F54B|nr:ABC transporter permease [Pseudonocardia spinosispora]